MRKIEREEGGGYDNFDRIPDPIILLILNSVTDVKSLGRCSSVSTRFRSLVPLVHSVHVTVDCVVSDDDTSSSTNKPRCSVTGVGGGGNSLSSFLRLVCRPFLSLLGGGGKRGTGAGSASDQLVTHHSPVQVLKNFSEIRVLKIELPSGELGVEEGVLLKWRASFGSTLDNCVILGASAVVYPTGQKKDVPITTSNEDNGSIPDSFYTNGGLKLRVVWTISSLIAASARHYLLQPIISDHKTLNNLILTDGDGQGVLCMNKDQLEELRVKPLSASSASKRTLVPALNMRLWYAPQLELPDGTVLKGATLVAIRPSEQAAKKEVADVSWVSAAFEEPFGTAAKMLVKRRTYCLEMNSF